MKYTTFDRHCPQMIRAVKCVKNDPLTDIGIENECFLLLVLTSGSVSFTVGSEKFTSTAPCLVCFDDKDAPVLTDKKDVECYAIYFHPTYLNVNMTLERIRDPENSGLLCAHEMFLCRPFLHHFRNLYIPINYVELIKSSADNLLYHLEAQPDTFWSCRGRASLIEVMVLMERVMTMSFEMSRESLDSHSARCTAGVQNAIQFIEANFHKDITYAQVLTAAGINRTDFSEAFREKYGMTAFRYLSAFRIEIAKKQVAFTNVPVKDIARRCGFKTVQHFTRIFKEFTGETPASYRKRTLAARIAEFQK